jgi:RNA polymerase sigma factor (sigma-70 family)
MKSIEDNGIIGSRPGAPPLLLHEAGEGLSRSEERALPRRTARSAVQGESWTQRSRRWGCLMMEARSGDSQAYEQLLRELDAWLCRYYARRLPHPAAEDARQDTLLAIHAKRHTYEPSRSFGAWVIGIARYKWIDRIRDASRYSALSLDDDIAVEDHEGAAISAAALDHLLGRLKPAQESVIRLVKLKGLSIAGASGATGQSAALVKVNIHRGLKKLAALVS